MVSITIATKSYEIPGTWSDMTAREGTTLHDLCMKEMPKELKDKYDIIMKSGKDDAEDNLVEWMDTLDPECEIKSFPVFYGKIIQHMAKVPQKIMDYTSIGSRYSVYTRYLEKFVFGLMHNGATYEAVKISSFVHNKHTYPLPKDKRMGDLIVPMHDLTTVQFCESSDLMGYINKQENGFKYATFIVAILCLREHEKYSDELVIQRAKEFEDLPIDIIWEVFFCLDNFMYTLNQDMFTYSHLRVLNQVRRVSRIIGEGSYLTYLQHPDTLWSLN